MKKKKKKPGGLFKAFTDSHDDGAAEIYYIQQKCVFPFDFSVVEEWKAVLLQFHTNRLPPGQQLILDIGEIAAN